MRERERAGKKTKIKLNRIPLKSDFDKEKQTDDREGWGVVFRSKILIVDQSPKPKRGIGDSSLSIDNVDPLPRQIIPPLKLDVNPIIRELLHLIWVIQKRELRK